MKRARETHGNNDSTPGSRVAAVKQNNNFTTKSNAAALGEIRAKLEQARMKKIAAEDRLLRQRQHDSNQMNQHISALPTSTATKEPATATTIAIAKVSLTTYAAATMTKMNPTQSKQSKDASTSRQGITPNSRIGNNSRAQEAQEALDRARSKLQGALQNRERAMLQQQRMNSSSGPFDPVTSSWNRKRRSSQQHYFSLQQQGRYVAHSNLPPISALSQSSSLRITDISRTGPPSMVYHYKDRIGTSTSSMAYLGSHAAFEAALGGKEAVEALHQGNDRFCSGGEKKCNNEKDGCGNDSGNNIRSHDDNAINNSKHTKATATTITSLSLVQRKIQLQNELMALKEKLEMKSSQEQKQKQKQQHQSHLTLNATANEDSRNTKIATKEGLERRKAEAQTVMDISYWKHFVSKQEHLLEQVTAKINNMDNNNHRNQGIPRGAITYKECLDKRHSTNKAIAKVQHDLDIIEKRQIVVEEGIVFSTRKLLEARQVLHDERTRKALEKKENQISIVDSNDS